MLYRNPVSSNHSLKCYHCIYFMNHGIHKNSWFHLCCQWGQRPNNAWTSILFLLSREVTNIDPLLGKISNCLRLLWSQDNVEVFSRMMETTDRWLKYFTVFYLCIYKPVVPEIHCSSTVPNWQLYTSYRIQF